MYFRLEKYIVDGMVEYLRRVFRYNSSWINQDLELVQLASGSAELVFEQFFEENEKYPVITIASAGGTFQSIAFNDYIDTYDNDRLVLGMRMQSSVQIDSNTSVAIQLPSTALGETLRGVAVTLAAISVANGEDNIQVNLYENFTTTPVLVSSASLPGNASMAYNELYGEFRPYVTLSGNDYWLTLQTTSQSVYSVGIDTSSVIQTMYRYASVNATGSINGGVILPAFVRLGTNYQGSVTIKTMAKNSTQQAFQLSDLVMQYITLGKHAQISRLSGATNGLKLAALLSEGVSELTEKAIFIRGIRVSGQDTRPRGDNDKIFSVTLTVDVYAEWHQDFQAEAIKEIVPDIIAFDP